MVPAGGHVTPPVDPRRPRESEIVAAARRYLEELGYRVWVNPDGRDYFDLVARRGAEVGLVEAKVSGTHDVLAQALRRRAWGDWVAVVLATERAAWHLAHRTARTRAAPIGVWWARRGTGVTVVRPARPWGAPGSEDPFSGVRARFHRLLDALEAGEIPDAIVWEGVVREVRRASGGRGFGEWRLEESVE
jgi:hypothetical protein